jgi:hypothetical protein
MLGDRRAAEPRKEARITHPDGEAAHVVEDRRQEGRRLDDAVGDVGIENGDVFVGDLADEGG